MRERESESMRPRDRKCNESGGNKKEETKRRKQTRRKQTKWRKQKGGEMRERE